MPPKNFSTGTISKVRHAGYGVNNVCFERAVRPEASGGYEWNSVRPELSYIAQ